MFQALLDLLFPRRSLRGEEGAWITENERRTLKLTPALLTTTDLRKRGLKSIDAVVAAGSYDTSPLLKKAVLTLKLRGIEDIAEELGHRMADAVHGLLILPKHLQDTTPILCPVPLHWTRRFHRGFNQADLLARAVSRELAWDVRPILERTRRTGKQALRARHERLSAMTDAFKSTVHPPRVVILIDDLCTTGATLDACASAVKDAGTEYVAALVAGLG